MRAQLLIVHAFTVAVGLQLPSAASPPPTHRRHVHLSMQFKDSLAGKMFGTLADGFKGIAEMMPSAEEVPPPPPADAKVELA